MKGRSQRLAAAAAAASSADDWVNGGWTVACSCGVTFDDGEEMVSCDKCGVWVHTRCSKFVRGQASFACHKCLRLADNDAKETEVAQLLVELPTKAGDAPPLPPFPRRPFRLWTEVPMEERVHVQGVPGGDPAIFSGLSPVFSAQLWKCSGYIPKKFNLKFREFPCWDAKEKGKEEEDGENPASRGADLLFSLSKDIVPFLPGRSLEQKLSPELVRKSDFGKGLSASRLQSISKKERSKLRVPGVQFGKRSRYEIGEGKHGSVNKKARSGADKSRGSVPILDSNGADLFEDGIAQVNEAKFQDEKIKYRRESLSSEFNATNQNENSDGWKSNTVVLVKTLRGSLSDKASKGKGTEESEFQHDRHDHSDQIRTAGLPKVDASFTSRGEDDYSNVHTKEEDVKSAGHSFRQPKVECYLEEVRKGDPYPGSGCLEDSKPVCADLLRSCSDAPDASTLLIAETSTVGSNLDKISVKAEREDDQATQNQQTETCQLPEERLHEVEHILHSTLRLTDHTDGDTHLGENTGNSPAQEQKQQIAERESTAVHKGCGKKGDEVFSMCSPIEGSAGSSEAEKSGNYVRGETTPPGLNENCSLISLVELPLEAEKGSSSTTTQTMSESVCGVCNVNGANAVDPSKTQVKVDRGASEKKDNGENPASSEEKLPDSSQPEDSHKGAACAGIKPSKSTIVSSASTCNPRPASSYSNHMQVSPLTATPSSENIALLSGLAEVNAPSQAHTSFVPLKLKSSTSSHKSERPNPTNPQSSSKLSHSATMHSPAPVTAITTLSDEELALLLHQELNSSPRVPRVPRIRQAAGQLVSPTGSSMLSKRSSSSGTKDHAWVPKRKGKEHGSTDSSRNNREVIGEIKRISRMNSSHSQKHQDLVLSADASKNDAQNRSPDIVTYVKKKVPIVSTQGAKSSLLEMDEQVSSLNKGVSDETAGLTSRNLPGLIGEIIGRSRDITLDELCDAVRPHWRKLRKPNGERYAYSSHSQAVLDCLRNRSEWAHLIGRGPKTNSNKRRRKLDSEMEPIDSENEGSKDKVFKAREDKDEELYREDFPRGKRKARKRRRLELRGRVVKDRKMQKFSLSDDNSAELSNSSNEVKETSSDDESQGTELHAGVAEASSSSSKESE